MIKLTKYVAVLSFGLFICSPTVAQRPGAKFDTSNMVRITGGTYIRGLDTAQLAANHQRFGMPLSFFMEEFPPARYSVQTFYMDKKEVTNAEFKKFIDANPRWSKKNIPDSLHDGNYLKDWNGDKYPKSKGDFPVVYVCSAAVYAYANWVGKRLPSEAEWEYTAKGSSYQNITFPWGEGDANKKLANYAQSGLGHTSQVGVYPPNSLGIYDMAGNVWEFCADLWRAGDYQSHADLTKAIQQNDRAKAQQLHLQFVTDRSKRTIRGGSWRSDAVKLRTTYRIGYNVKSCTDSVGFRCAANYFPAVRK